MKNLQGYYGLIGDLRKIINNYYWNSPKVECVVLKNGMDFAIELVSKKTETKFNLHFIDCQSINNEFVIKLVGLYPETIDNQNLLIIDKIYNDDENFHPLVNFMKSYNPKTINYVSLIPATFKGAM